MKIDFATDELVDLSFEIEEAFNDKASVLNGVIRFSPADIETNTGPMRLGFLAAELKLELYGYKVLSRVFDKSIPQSGPQKDDAKNVNIQALAGNRWHFKAPANEILLSGAVLEEGDGLCILQFDASPTTNAVGVSGALNVRTRDIDVQPIDAKQSAVSLIGGCMIGKKQNARDAIIEVLVAKSLHKSGVGSRKAFRGILTVAQSEHFPTPDEMKF